MTCTRAVGAAVNEAGEVVAHADQLGELFHAHVKQVGNGVSELRLDVGPGYRVSYIHDGDVLILLLCGGDKSTQQKDIDEAQRLANEWRADMKESSDERQE
ncbi:MAG: type II toxin-antitoxin system RelE/ParE family toxin [Ilumatobacteraceae bacterium]